MSEANYDKLKAFRSKEDNHEEQELVANIEAEMSKRREAKAIEEDKELPPSIFVDEESKQDKPE